jgi:hypothetical protein
MICRYCKLDVTEADIESHDGNCPECGMFILKSQFDDEIDEDEEDGEENEEWPDDDLDENDEDDELAGIDLDGIEIDEDLPDDFEEENGNRREKGSGKKRN